ncbi:hypothetical protein [Scytonema sp. NUACC26]|uniref:hypothetical protein n=1 Tax=Scytonema sp. NUACC26 TaxID=3140176 RepID=UPI0034DC9B13
MHLNRRFAYVAFISLTLSIALSIMLSVIGIEQLTLANPPSKPNLISLAREGCDGGFSEEIRVGGQVVNPKTFTLADLQSLPPEEVQVNYITMQGPESHTYVGVPLWTLIQLAGGLKPNPDLTVNNNSIRQYIALDATNCYQVVVGVGEVDPDYEGKQVLVAYATKDDPSEAPQLLGDRGFARLVVPGDKRGGRYIFNIRRISVFYSPFSRYQL